MKPSRKHQLALGKESLMLIENKLKELGFVEASVFAPSALSVGQYIKVPEQGGQFQFDRGGVNTWTVHWLQD